MPERAARTREPTTTTRPRRRPARRAAATGAADARGADPGLDDEDARLARLERLGALREKGILTDEEFAAEKARILDRGGA